MLQYSVTAGQRVASSQSPAALFGVQVGGDTSGNFALSLEGLAVRTPDGRYVALSREWNCLLDVTALITPINAYVYRLPATAVRPGDLLVTSDLPSFSALYVLNADDLEEIEGLDTGTAQVVRYRPPRNLILNFVVKVVSLWDLLIER